MVEEKTKDFELALRIPVRETYREHTRLRSPKVFNIVLERDHQKRDIVDTKTHASCSWGPNKSCNLTLPILWERKARSTKKNTTHSFLSIVLLERKKGKNAVWSCRDFCFRQQSYSGIGTGLKKG